MHCFCIKIEIKIDKLVFRCCRCSATANVSHFALSSEKQCNEIKGDVSKNYEEISYN